MTAEEAYERGQRDMRDRIIKQWEGWVQGELAAWQLTRPGIRPRGDIGVAIRKRNPVLPLSSGSPRP